MRKIDRIIVHCTATPEGREVTINEIDKWHRDRGFNGVGYHYVINLKGEVLKGREEYKIGAHCKGYNKSSIGVCYVGGLDEKMKSNDTRTEEQKIALLELLKELKLKYPDAVICGHREFANKDCPCFDARKEYKHI